MQVNIQLSKDNLGRQYSKTILPTPICTGQSVPDRKRRPRRAAGITFKFERLCGQLRFNNSSKTTHNPREAVLGADIAASLSAHHSKNRTRQVPWLGATNNLGQKATTQNQNVGNTQCNRSCASRSTRPTLHVVAGPQTRFTSAVPGELTKETLKHTGNTKQETKALHHHTKRLEQLWGLQTS